MGWFWEKRKVNKGLKEVPKRRWSDTIEHRIWELDRQIDDLRERIIRGGSYGQKG